MAEVFMYPLTPIPLSISDVDATMKKTPKSSLLHHLESKVITLPPSHVDTTVIDAGFFLHLQTNSSLPASFGDVDRYLLKRIMISEGNGIYFVTDKWIPILIIKLRKKLTEFIFFFIQYYRTGSKKTN